MKHYCAIVGLLLGATFSTAAVGAPPASTAPVAKGVDDGPVTVPAFGPRFKEIHERVDALYRYRNGSYPMPDTQLNLFRVVPDAVVPTNVAKVTPKEPVDSDDAILQQAVATLKGGVLVAGGRSYLSVDRKRYQEGDVIPVRVKDRPVSLLIERLSIASVTFSLNDAELTVRFSGSRF